MNEVIEVLVPYRQTFIRWRHRLREQVVLWSVHRVTVPTVEPEVAPVAYRIVPIRVLHNESNPECSVRSFEDKFWWPLLDANGPVSSAEFVSLAAKGSDRVLTTLGCPRDFPYSIQRPSVEDFLDEHPKSRLVGSTLDTQLNRVNHGAARLAFCDGAVLVDAGQPLYYAIEPWDGGDIEILAGPSSLDPAPDEGYRLPGPDLFRRRASAAKGLAFGTEGLSQFEGLLAERKLSERLSFRIENLLQHSDEVAPFTCARALAERLWRGVASGSAWDWPWLRRYVPSLAKAGEADASIDGMSHRRALEEFVAVDWATVTSQLSQEVSSARQILSRLDEIGHSPLSKDDDDALSGLGI